MSITCPQCGASFDSTSRFCKYCDSKLPFSNSMSEGEKERLKTYISGVEQILNSEKNNNDGSTALFFFGACIAWVGTTYVIYRQTESILFTIILSLVSGLIYFIIFGWYVTRNEARSLRKAFDDHVRQDMKEYLKKNRIDEQDLKLVAFEVIDKDSPLYPFLTEF